MDERLLEAHLAPIREDIREIKGMLSAAQELGRERGEEMAAMRVEIAFLKRVVFGACGVAGLLMVETILTRLI